MKLQVKTSTIIRSIWFATVMSRIYIMSIRRCFADIELEKQQRNLFFIRPRCFGKPVSSACSTLYHDSNQKESFEKLFGNLWIGQHPTSLQGIYQALFFQITGKIVVWRKDHAYLCINKLDSFAEQYFHFRWEEGSGNQTKTQVDKMQIILMQPRANHFQLYLYHRRVW